MDEIHLTQLKGICTWYKDLVDDVQTCTFNISIQLNDRNIKDN